MKRGIVDLGTAQIIQGNALNLPLPDSSVDLVCTSPPYFGLRSYQDGCRTCTGSPDSYRVKTCSGCGETTGRVKCHNNCGVPMKWTKPERSPVAECPDCGGTGKGHYDGQIGSEATPAEFLDALLAATGEMVRVLKPTGSIFVNLGDKYAGGGSGPQGPSDGISPGYGNRSASAVGLGPLETMRQGARDGNRRSRPRPVEGIPTKSLMGIPWRYAIACIDQLELILRAEIIWAKPNGLPESVTDRVRRSHEQWFHFTVQPRYYSAVDEIREPHSPITLQVAKYTNKGVGDPSGNDRQHNFGGYSRGGQNPLGKMPGSVWTVATQPLTVPPELGVDHFAAYPMEWPRRIITGWTPQGICTVCGEGRRPLSDVEYAVHNPGIKSGGQLSGRHNQPTFGAGAQWSITGYVCGCPTPTAPTTPAIVLDPFGGTGTTALVAKALGRTGITIDLSADYCRLASWRCNDPRELAAALEVEKPEPINPNQLDLFGGTGDQIA